MKLFTKFNRINISVMIVVFLLSGVIYYAMMSRVLVHELDDSLYDYKDGITSYIQNNKKLPPAQCFDETEISFKKSGQTSAALVSSVSRYSEEDGRNSWYRQLVFTQKIGTDIYEITVAKPVEGARLLTKVIVFITCSVLLLVILLTILLNRIILRKLWQPFYSTLGELKNFRLGGGKLPSFPATNIEEFAFMNQSLEDVTKHASNDYTTLKEFTENASHELQTPLAIIRSKLDLVIQEEGLSEGQSAALGSAYEGIHRLTKLNQSLLLLAKIDNQQFAGKELIDLKDRIEQKLKQFSEVWAGNNLQLTTSLQPAMITANAELADILLNNLLSNAGRHNGAAGKIDIVLTANDLSISNTGAEKELDRQKIFNRFYKEVSGSQSNGLGLSIVKQICDHSGIGLRYIYEDGKHSFVLSWQ